MNHFGKGYLDSLVNIPALKKTCCKKVTEP